MAATVSYTIEYPDRGDGTNANGFPEGVRIVKWANMANGDVGVPYIAPNYPDKSVQVTGTLGTGGSCRIEGTNVCNGSAVWATLHDPAGNALDINNATTTGLKQILENTYQIRPEITAGDGTTSLTVRLLIWTGARR